MMTDTCLAARSPIPEATPVPAAIADPDRRTLVYLLSFLLVGFERLSGQPRAPAAAPQPPWLEHWEDDEYLYFETRIPDDASGLEMDLHLHGGLIFARVGQRDPGAEIAPPPLASCGACPESPAPL
jgi:hypothetical protein